MDKSDLEKILDSRASCPSEIMLDRFHFGELPAKEQEILQIHVAGCGNCQERLALRQKGFSAFAELGAKEVERVRQRLEQTLLTKSANETLRPKDASIQAPGGGHQPRLLRPLWVTGFAALAASILVVLVWWMALSSNTIQEPETIQSKGGLGWTVYRERAGSVSETSNGDRFRAGDRLRFKLELPSDGQVMVVGVEQSGAVYAAYPADGSSVSIPVAAGVGVMLPGAVLLDESIGQEWLYLVFCPRPFSFSDIQKADMPGDLRLPSGCRRIPFLMEKDAP